MPRKVAVLGAITLGTSMDWEKSRPDTVTARGLKIALVFALVVERLRGHYEYGEWLTQAQAARLVADWLARSGRALAAAERYSLAAASDTLARRIAAELSRPAGLYLLHELSEALDPARASDLAQTVMAECERVCDADGVV